MRRPRGFFLILTLFFFPTERGRERQPSFLWAHWRLICLVFLSLQVQGKNFLLRPRHSFAVRDGAALGAFHRSGRKPSEAPHSLSVFPLFLRAPVASSSSLSSKPHTSIHRPPYRPKSLFFFSPSRVHYKKTLSFRYPNILLSICLSICLSRSIYLSLSNFVYLVLYLSRSLSRPSSRSLSRSTSMLPRLSLVCVYGKIPLSRGPQRSLSGAR